MSKKIDSDKCFNVDGDRYMVYRWIDKEAGVVCYIFTRENAGGISCVPIKDTLLEKDKRE